MKPVDSARNNNRATANAVPDTGMVLVALA